MRKSIIYRQVECKWYRFWILSALNKTAVLQIAVTVYLTSLTSVFSSVKCTKDSCEINLYYAYATSRLMPGLSKLVSENTLIFMAITFFSKKSEKIASILVYSSCSYS